MKYYILSAFYGFFEGKQFQHLFVKEKLSARAGEKISFICLGSDIEAVNFKNQLVSLFKTHKWEVHTHEVILFGKAQPPGLKINVKNKKYIDRAKDVQFILNTLGFNADVFYGRRTNQEVQVIVNAKPRKPAN
jgi:hypothetical protein